MKLKSQQADNNNYVWMTTINEKWEKKTIVTQNAIHTREPVMSIG